MTGFVYFLRCGDFVKIGFSTKPEARIRYLQTATPFNFELVGRHPGTRHHEKQLHKIFASLRHRHEWFLAHEAILQVARDGLPSMDIREAVLNPLNAYLVKNRIHPADFAKEIGVTREGLRLWLTGGRTPRQTQMKKIIEATGGVVTPNDFLSPEPRGATQ